MKAVRSRLTVAVVVLLVLLSGCNALNEAATSEVTKEPAAIERAYASAYPLQATYSSTTVGEPKWYRPLYDLGGWYVPMTEIYELPYHVQAFRVATDGPYSVFSTQWFDGYLYLYGGGFNPTDQLVGLLTGNDDYMAIVGYSLIERELVSGTTYYIVTTGYSYGTAGAFTNDIYGPGAVTLGGTGDTTPPVITASVDGTLGDNGWYVGAGDVVVTWSYEDPESAIDPESLVGCDMAIIAMDTMGPITLSCTASSAGGTASGSVSILRDATAPVVTVTNVENGATYVLGDVPSAGCATEDGTSGVAQDATVSLAGGPTGEITVSCLGARDVAGNVGSAFATYFVEAPDPAAATEALVDDVEQLLEDGVLKAGQAKGLLNPLENALRSLEKENTADACNQLADFIIEVEAKVPPLTEAQADDLIGSASAIRDMLGCE